MDLFRPVMGLLYLSLLFFECRFLSVLYAAFLYIINIIIIINTTTAATTAIKASKLIN